MHHFFEAITNTKGDALTGYYVRVVSGGVVQTLYADTSLTPIVSVSGIADAALVDSDGNVNFYIAVGTYDLDIYATDGTTKIKTVENIGMNIDADTAASATASATAAAASAATASAAAAVSVAASAATASITAAETAIIAALAAGGSVTLPTLEASGLPYNVKWFGAVGNGTADDTGAIQAALDAGSRILIPAGTYIVSTLSVSSNTEILTEGFDTIIKQKSGTAAGTRIISVNGSNVNIGDHCIEGRLGQAGDTTGEQNHGIFIYIAAADTGSRSNITIGNVKGTNIRGDVVMTGVHPTAYTAGYRLSQISMGKIIGANVFRAVVSITGGSDISIESVTGTQVGMIVFNIEQDTGSGPVTGLRVGYIKGRTCQFAGATAADYVEAWVGHIDVDPGYTTTSTPDYGGTKYRNGLTYRNCKSLRVERLYANGHYGQAILPVTGALTRQNVSFGTIEIPTSCLTEATLNCYIMGDATTWLTIDNLFATTTLATHYVIFTHTNTRVGVAQIALVTGSSYMQSCTDCSTGILNMTKADATGGAAIVSCTRTNVFGGIQAGARFYNFCTRCTALGVDATMSVGYDNGAIDTNLFVASRIGGVYVYINDQTSTFAVNSGGTLTAAGSIQSSSASAGVGYAAGAGGTVTQATSRTTGVTLNKVCGAITLVSAAGSASWQTFTVTNSTVAATDTVRVVQKSGTDLNMIHVTNVAAGSFKISFATTGGTTTEQPVFNFSVLKAVAA